MLHSVTATGHPVNLAFYPVPFCRGVPRDTTVRQDRLLVRTSLQNLRLTSTTQRAKMDEMHGIQLAARTVRKRLLSAGLRGCVAAKQPHLRPQIVMARLRFARQHKDRTGEQLNNVLWSDESSFQIFCGAKWAFIRRRKGESLAHSALSPQLSMEGVA